VDPVRLRAVGATVDQVADSVARAYRQHADELRIGAVDGWDCAAVARTAGDRWAGFVQGLARSVRQVGGELSSAGQQYHSSDDAAAARMGRTGRLE
jgi:hypothetical protein